MYDGTHPRPGPGSDDPAAEDDPSRDGAVGHLLAGWRDLLDPAASRLTAEMTGSELIGMLLQATGGGADVGPMLLAILDDAERTRRPEALAMARVLAVVAPPPVRPAAGAAADRLVAAGLTDPAWVAGLGAPSVAECFGYGDTRGAQQVISVAFRYEDDAHVLSVLIDHELGGGVKDCWFADDVPAVRASARRAGRARGMVSTEHPPAEAHRILARALSRPPCPVQPDQVEDVASYVSLLRQRVDLLVADAAGRPSRGRALSVVPPMPESPRPAGPSRGSADRARRPARTPTVHRLKVALRGAKPPIWRRLEVPSTMSLQALHDVVQGAFGWTDTHLWVFETDSGEYGLPDPELGHRNAASARLTKVAPQAGDRFDYTYDFGDDWRHAVTVESVHPAEPGVAYPRCTAGRRAGPPEDSGGVWGYGDLIEALADPAHPEHAHYLEWLGLDSPQDFDPAAFPAGEIDAVLARMARVLVK